VILTLLVFPAFFMFVHIVHRALAFGLEDRRFDFSLHKVIGEMLEKDDIVIFVLVIICCAVYRALALVLQDLSLNSAISR
jgi:hypothetical protein